MSRLFRFLSAPCREHNDRIVAEAIADWLVSPERMRFRHETEKNDMRPGHCHLCGAETEGAFYITSPASPDVRCISKGHAEFARVRAVWLADGITKDANGNDWAVQPIFYCAKAVQGPTRKHPRVPDLFAMAENIVNIRKAEAAKREQDALKAESSGAQGKIRMKSGL